MAQPSHGEHPHSTWKYLYARACVPVHLLIDREAGQVTVCASPEDDDYTTKSSYRTGLAVPLPAPLGFDLDTAEF
ncbi:hypothetical protein ABII15_18560 [Streptomyces sp. HUAS MG91]|uniref:Restriction endonuclease domain-containing protein n=1 Tax=Streptomyces tabacisoli TaxID=3156398 RepID=A0AAU8IVL3_9ACTN